VGLFETRDADFFTCSRGFPHLRKKRYDQFTATVLGLGDLTAPSKETDSVAAVFDLSGFTKFCNQIDPQLAVSEYLASFLDWLFKAVKEESVVNTPKGKKKDKDSDIPAWATLPFFAKFLGDGVLFLWDASKITEKAICSIPTLGLQVSARYYLEFLPKISFEVVDPPQVLRCGIARGKVLSVGDGQDFVGPCINMASRLQKLSDIPVSFSRRGFNAEKHMNPHMRGHFLLKKVAVRGVGEHELVYVSKDEFEELPESEKSRFEDPAEEFHPDLLSSSPRWKQGKRPPARRGGSQSRGRGRKSRNPVPAPDKT
jgi:class 3 adenylate cyclase